MKTRGIQLTRGDHRGISFEVCHPANGYKFSYYVFLNIERFEDRDLAESLWVKPYDTEFGKVYGLHKLPFLNDVHFHGGLTWYSKSFNTKDDRIIKAGCDYGHLWDEGCYYDIEMVLADVKRTIDEIHDSTRYLMFCNGDGSIVPESEGRYSRHGDFWSNAYIIKQGMEDQFNTDPTESPSDSGSRISPNHPKEDII